jgi:hypothetical protein
MLAISILSSSSVILVDWRVLSGITTLIGLFQKSWVIVEHCGGAGQTEVVFKSLKWKYPDKYLNLIAFETLALQCFSHLRTRQQNPTQETSRLLF